MDFSPGNITALVIAASFAAGLNIYATVLTLGILARTHWVALPPGLDSLGHTWVLAVCAEMIATGVGAAVALATHSSKTALRAAVTPSPEPVSNIALSSAEDVVAVGLTWF